MDYKTGDFLCGCNLLQKCGEGAYGAVWLAVDPIGTRVALKIIPNRGRYSERELAGLRNYKDCNHPNLLKIRHIELLDDAVCYTMDAADDLNSGAEEYLPDTLANRLRKFKRLDGQEVVAMLEGLLAGLDELHRNGLVHRDIKPDNILWVAHRPTLADAGLIAPEGQGSLVGTPGFLSPKLLAGKGRADASDDFYALGKVIYCALTGNPVEEYPSIPRDVTISVDAALGRACRESCKRPIHSTEEFRELLREKPMREPFPWKFFTAAVLFVLLSAGAGGLGVALYFRESPTVLPPVAAVPVKKPTHSAAATIPPAQTARPAAKPTPVTVPKQSPVTVPPVPKPTPVTVPPVPKPTPVTVPPVPKPTPVTVPPVPKPTPVTVPPVPKPTSVTVPKATQSVPVETTRPTTVPTRDPGVEELKLLGFWSENRLEALLDYLPMTAAACRDRLARNNENPRLVPVGAPRVRPKTVSDSERWLLEFYSHAMPDFDPYRVAEHQKYWRAQAGAPLEIQRRMLERDPLMRAVTFDAVMRVGVNTVLQAKTLDESAKRDLLSLREFRRQALNL